MFYHLQNLFWDFFGGGVGLEVSVWWFWLGGLCLVGFSGGIKFSNTLVDQVA